MIDLKEIQQRLENNDTYKYYHDAIGITFADFRIINPESSECFKDGKRDIGSYDIYIKNDGSMSVFFDLTVKGLNEIRLKQVGEDIEGA